MVQDMGDRMALQWQLVALLQNDTLDNLHCQPCHTLSLLARHSVNCKTSRDERATGSLAAKYPCSHRGW